MLALLGRLGLFAAQGIRPRIARLRRNLIASALAGFCFLVAIVSAIASGWIFLADRIGAGWAGLVIAGVALVLGLFILCVVALINYAERRRHRRLTSVAAAAADPLTLGLAGRLPKMIKANPILGVTAVGVLAFLFARSQGIGRDPD